MKAENPDIKIQVEAFLSRGIESVFPSKDAFVSALNGGRKISIYYGIDPTGPTLHMGHAVPLMKLAELQKMGHEVVLLIGDFTAMIGDPTDKGTARKQLTRKEVLANCKIYKKQASRFLSFSGKNAAKLKFNSKWLAKMRFEDIVNLASNMTVQQMIERDMFEKRIEEGKPIFIHEFLYPLMQGYDSVALDIDAEIGGNDQTFNMLAGRTLMKSLKNKDKFVIATKLLVDPTGKKMGKSEGNMITMLDSANDMFGKVMSWPDTMIISTFQLCTKVPDDAIAREKAALESGANPRDSKMKLAHAVAELYHGTDAADKAKASFIAAFSTGSAGTMPADALEVATPAGSLLSDVLIGAKLIASKGEFKRLVSEKAIKDLKSGKITEAFDQKVAADMDLKIGKHRFARIRIK